MSRQAYIGNLKYCKKGDLQNSLKCQVLHISVLKSKYEKLNSTMSECRYMYIIIRLPKEKDKPVDGIFSEQVIHPTKFFVTSVNFFFIN